MIFQHRIRNISKYVLILSILATLQGCTHTITKWDVFSEGVLTIAPKGSIDLGLREECQRRYFPECDNLKSMSYLELAILQRRVLNRFIYVRDDKNFGQPDYWMSTEEIPEEGPIRGDCEDFCQAYNVELSKYGERAYVQLVGTKSKRLNHAVCRYNNYLIDNTHSFPITRTDVPFWTFISHSINNKEWYKTIVLD